MKKTEGRRQKTEGAGLVASAVFFLAQSRQEDVLKSISDNVSQAGDGSGRMFLAILLGVVALIVLVTVINARSKREANPKSPNHPGKLIKELAKQIPLRPVELKHLKSLAQGERDAGKPITSPLVFLLCPSAFAGAARAQRVKVDRKVMAGLAKKLGLLSTPVKAKR
jgi:hypothetical protein